MCSAMSDEYDIFRFQCLETLYSTIFASYLAGLRYYSSQSTPNCAWGTICSSSNRRYKREAELAACIKSLISLLSLQLKILFIKNLSWKGFWSIPGGFQYDYSTLCAQESVLIGFWRPNGVPGPNPHWLYARSTYIILMSKWMVYFSLFAFSWGAITDGTQG